MSIDLLPSIFVATGSATVAAQLFAYSQMVHIKCRRAFTASSLIAVAGLATGFLRESGSPYWQAIGWIGALAMFVSGSVLAGLAGKQWFASRRGVN
jgi:hypothetical protein